MTAGRSILVAAAFAAILTVVHAGHLSNPFLHDDIHSIEENTSIRSLRNIPDFFVDPTLFSVDRSAAMYRPILLTTYAINHAISETRPWSYRLLNIIIHAINATLLIVLLTKLIGEKPSFVAGLLFLLNPLSGRTFELVSSRSALLLTLFMLATLILYLKARASAGKGSMLYYACSLLTAVGCHMSVASAVILPAFVLMAEIVAGKGDWKRFLRAAPFVAITLGYLVLRKAIMGAAFGSGYVRSVWVNAAQQFEILYIYLRMIFFPVDSPLFYPVDDSTSFAEIGVIVAVIATAIWCVVGLWKLREKKPAGLLILWPLAAFFPYASIPLNVPVAEHHFYPSLAGICALVALIASEVMQRRLKYAAPMLAVVLVSWAAILHHRGEPWRMALGLSYQATRLAPESERAWNELGSSFTADSRYREAGWALDRALALDKGNLAAIYNRALNNYYREDFEGAVRDMMKFRDLTKDLRPTGYIDGIIGMALFRQGKPLLALPYLDSAVADDGSRRETRIDRARVYLMVQKPEKSILDCNAMIDANPSDVEALTIRASAWIAIDATKARADLSRLRSLGVRGGESNMIEAKILLKEGRVGEAEKIIDAELARDPRSGQLWTLKGRCAERLGKPDQAVAAYEKALSLPMPDALKKELAERIERIRSGQEN